MVLSERSILGLSEYTLFELKMKFIYGTKFLGKKWIKLGLFLQLFPNYFQIVLLL